MSTERDAYLRGERDARMRLGGEGLVHYLDRCAMLRMEPDPVQIAALVRDHQVEVEDDDGPDCLGPEGDCIDAHVPPCPLADEDLAFDEQFRPRMRGEVVGRVVSIDGEWYVAQGLGWKSKMAAIKAWQHAEEVANGPALRAIRTCRDALTETARHEVLMELSCARGDDEAARVWQVEALGHVESEDA